jgi:hypothetical protein
MKARAFMVGLAMVIAGAGCSNCYPVQTVFIDSGMLTGTVTGLAALGSPVAVQDLGSSRGGGQLSLSFDAKSGAPAAGMDEYRLLVQVRGPDLAFGQSVTLPNPLYPEFSPVLFDVTNDAGSTLPFPEGTLTLKGTTSNGTITNEELVLTLSLGLSDGSLGVDVGLPSRLHTVTEEACASAATD